VFGMTCATLSPSAHLAPRRTRARPPSLVRATLANNGRDALSRGPLVAVMPETSSRIVRANGSRLWCSRYPGLAGLFRKDRGPSKELGRALCDDVKREFGCDGFLTTDELPRYGIGRDARRQIRTAAYATEADCVVVYAYPEDLARQIDDYLFDRLRSMS
jgi:Glu-tRNA(Gln) amidotransferase subunit E-like FAD-binding protein